jgi:hypothetical protein
LSTGPPAVYSVRSGGFLDKLAGLAAEFGDEAR